MRTETIELYSIYELPEAAKKKAIAKYRTEMDHSWRFQEAFDSLRKFADIFNITLNGVDLMSARASQWRHNLDDNALQLSGQRLCTYIWNNFRRDIFKGKYYGKLVDTFKDGSPIPVSKQHPAGKRHVKRYSNCQLSDDCVLTGICYDMSLLNPIYEYLKAPDDRDFRQLLNDCIYDLADDIQSEVEAAEQDDHIMDEMESNDYEFYLNGTQYK